MSYLAESRNRRTNFFDVLCTLLMQRTHVDEARVVVESAQVRPRERQEGVEPRREVLRESAVKPLHQPPYCLAGY